MPPGSPNYGDRPGDMRRGKCSTANAAVVLDEVDGGGERAALKLAVPHASHGEPRTLNRQECGDDVGDRKADGGVRHDRPIRVPLAVVIEDAVEHQQINKIG